MRLVHAPARAPRAPRRRSGGTEPAAPRPPVRPFAGRSIERERRSARTSAAARSPSPTRRAVVARSSGRARAGGEAAIPARRLARRRDRIVSAGRLPRIAGGPGGARLAASAPEGGGDHVRSFLSTSAASAAPSGLPIIAAPASDLAKTHARIEGDRRQVGAFDLEKQRPHVRGGQAHQAVGQQGAADAAIAKGGMHRDRQDFRFVGRRAAKARSRAASSVAASTRGAADRRLARQQRLEFGRSTRNGRKRPREAPRIVRPCRCAARA